jgi:tetratricopeptide (TPR) repeat protein
LSRQQVDAATGRSEWAHQECLGAQCKFYNVPEADCQFLIAGRSGSLALPLAGDFDPARLTSPQADPAELARRVEEALGKSLSGLSDSLRRVEERQNELSGALRDVQDTLEGMGKLRKTIDRLGSEVEKIDLEARLAPLTGRLEEVAGRQSQALDSLTRLEGGLAPLTQRLDEVAGRQSQALEALTRLEVATEEGRQALMALQALRDTVTSLPARHDELAARVRGDMEEALKTQVGTLGSRFVDDLKAHGADQARAIDALGESLVRNNGRLLGDLRRVEQTGEKSAAALQADVQKISQSLDALGSVMATVRAAAERAPSENQALGKQVIDLHQFTKGALDASRQRNDGLWSQVETVGRSIGQLALIVKALQGEVERANASIGSVRAESKGVLLAFHEHKMAQQEEQKRRHAEQARELNNKGVALFHRGSLEGAIEAFIRAIELKPDYAEGYNNLGLAYSKRGQSDEAVRYFQKALEADPQMGEVYNNLGFLFHTSARYERAIEMFSRSLQTSADQSIAYTNLGNTFYKMKQNEKAVAAWRKALEIDPLNDSARRGLGMFQQDPAPPAPAGKA